MGYFVFKRTTNKYRVQKILAMLVVAIAEKSQHGRVMLELFARQRYERHRIKTAVPVSVPDGLSIYIPVPPLRLPSDPLDQVVRYLYDLDELAVKRAHREIRVAQWLAYHRLFVCGALLSDGMMECRLVGFHETITVDMVIWGPPDYHRLEYGLTVGTYLRLYWAKYYDYDENNEVTWDGAWRVTQYLPEETNPHRDIGFLNVTLADNGTDYEGVVVCVYAKLPKVTANWPNHNDYRQYDVVIMGKSDRYCYDEWEELYWPFTQMVIEQRAMVPGEGSAADNSGGGSDDESLFSDNS